MWAVIDIGSNTIRLVIYTLENGRPHSMLNKKYPAGLAGYIDQANRITPEGIQVLLDVLTDIQSILQYIRPQSIFPFGTASLRNSANGAEIVALIRERCGLDVRILTGEEEAIFDYYGALENNIGDSGLLMDVGGGSTELTFFKNKQIVSATSIPLGSLNLYKKWVDSLLPTSKEAHRIKQEVRGYLHQLPLPTEDLDAQPVYSVGGTARAALKLMKAKYDLGEKEEYTLVQLKGFLLDIKDNPRRLLHDILRAAPDRVHTMIPGLLVFQAVAKYFHSVSFVTSSFGVREGYLMHQLAEMGEHCV